jgi:hypothetical protein
MKLLKELEESNAGSADTVHVREFDDSFGFDGE